MPSEQDIRIQAAVAAITGPQGQMPVTTFVDRGIEMPLIAAAPPALPHYFAFFCATHADKTFIVDGDERLTFAQTHALATEVAQALVRAHGVKRGDRVGIAMRNAPSWIVLYMAVLMAGGVATLLNGWWTGDELAEGINDVDASLVFVDPPRAKRLAESSRTTGARLVEIDLAQPIAAAMAPVLGAPPQGDDPLPEMTGDDLATILFTSGSTGRSKGAYSTHRAVVQATFNYIVQALVMLHMATEDGTISADAPQHATLLTVPLFHVTGEVPMMLVSFAIGRKIVMMPKWNPLTAMQLIQAEKVTNFTGVPLMSFEILTHPDRDKYDLSTIQSFAAGGAPRPAEHVRRLDEEMTGGPPALGYGLTETNGVGCGNFGGNYVAKPTSTGLATKPLVDLAILDGNGKPVPQGQRGEVAIRSIANFSGYWNRDDATRDAFTSDAYFLTGDIGYLDEDDYLFIVDRKKDIIIRGGENISCQEVEAAIYAHPDVAECAVFGLPDERLGEVVGAVVHGRAIDAAALTEFLGAHLAAFKIPLHIWIAPEPLPRLGTEKIDKVSLRNRFRAEWAEAQAATAAA